MPHREEEDGMGFAGLIESREERAMRKDLGTTAERNKKLAEARRVLDSDKRHIDNLETLVVRLARQIEKQSGGDSKLADQAMHYLSRQARGAQSILRSKPAVSPSVDKE